MIYMGNMMIKDRSFYRTFFSMFVVVALQNLVAYSVNMADNMMLGNYSQEALSGASCVNQIFFLVQSYSTALGTALTTLCSQYWGRKDTGSVRLLAGAAVSFSLLSGIAVIFLCTAFSRPLLLIFTSSEAVIEQGEAYLSVLKWSFLLFILSNILISFLRSIGTVNISFWISLISLIVNVSINYTLIFGRFGFPEMGIRGAAVGTLIARFLELGIVLFYLLKREKKIHLHAADLLRSDAGAFRGYMRVFWPTLASQMLWAISVPLQTAILGHLSDDALAANSVATTFFQYLKVIVTAMSSTAEVVIGNTIGEGKPEKIHQEAVTIAVIDLAAGIILGAVLLALRAPLLSMYSLSDSAMQLASNLIVIMSVIMVGMSYHVPISSGIFAGGGDVKYRMYLNLISIWLIVMPLSFAAAFWWRLPVEAVVICIQSDQIFKCVPCTIRLLNDKWIHNLT